MSLSEPMNDSLPVAEISQSNINALFHHLRGKMLTIIDATVPNPTQNKAAKDLVRQTLDGPHHQMSLWVWEARTELFNDGQDMVNPKAAFPFWIPAQSQ